jgi:hypothetical protein
MAVHMEPQRKRRDRQLALSEQGQETPPWTTLPIECRREVVALLAKMLRSERAEEEVADE